MYAFFLASVFFAVAVAVVGALSTTFAYTDQHHNRAVSVHWYASFTLRLVVLFNNQIHKTITKPNAKKNIRECASHSTNSSSYTQTHSGDIQCYSMHYILKATHHFKHLVFSAFHLLALAHYYYYYDCFVRFSESCLVCVKSARERGRLKTRSNSTLS